MPSLDQVAQAETDQPVDEDVALGAGGDHDQAAPARGGGDRGDRERAGRGARAGRCVHGEAVPGEDRGQDPPLVGVQPDRREAVEQVCDALLGRRPAPGRSCPTRASRSATGASQSSPTHDSGECGATTAAQPVQVGDDPVAVQGDRCQQEPPAQHRAGHRGQHRLHEVKERVRVEAAPAAAEPVAQDGRQVHGTGAAAGDLTGEGRVQGDRTLDDHGGVAVTAAGDLARAQQHGHLAATRHGHDAGDQVAGAQAPVLQRADDVTEATQPSQGRDPGVRVADQAGQVLPARGQQAGLARGVGGGHVEAGRLDGPQVTCAGGVVEQGRAGPVEHGTARPLGPVVPGPVSTDGSSGEGMPSRYEIAGRGDAFRACGGCSVDTGAGLDGRSAVDGPTAAGQP